MLIWGAIQDVSQRLVADSQTLCFSNNRRIFEHILKTL